MSIHILTLFPAPRVKRKNINAFLLFDQYYQALAEEHLKGIHRFIAKDQHLAKSHWTTNYSDNTITINVVILLSNS